MNQPLISVIVPVYNAEPYFQKCVDSIRNQTYQDLEIILVDDGSPDRCGTMCDTFAAEDTRIRVIHKENGGQSSARNAALDIAQGEYIGFVDSDDWIEPNMYQHLYDMLVGHGAQISACGGQLDYPDGSVSYFNAAYPRDKEMQEFSNVDALREVIRNQKITNSLCDKLYCRGIFESVRMTEGKIYEDMEVIPKCVELAELVVYDPVPLYHYTQTLKSTIRGEFNLMRFAEADVALEKAKDYYVRYPELYADAMAYYIGTCLNIIYYSRGVPSCAQRRKELIKLIKGPLPDTAIHRLRRNSRIKLYALRLGVPVFHLAMTVNSWLTGKK